MQAGGVLLLYQIAFVFASTKPSVAPSHAPSFRPTVSPEREAALESQYLTVGLIAFALCCICLCIFIFKLRKKLGQPIARLHAEEFKSPSQNSQPARMIYDDKIGLGLSGGGVRSAAFVSGVLWGLINLIPIEEDDRSDDIFNGGRSVSLPQGHMPKFISCVSGGGYVGSSFTYWSRVKRGADPREWSEEYFERMRKGIGYYWDFSTLYSGFLDVSVFVVMMSCLIALSILAALPTTYVLGEFLLLPYSAYYNAFGDFPSCFPNRTINCINDYNSYFTNASGTFSNMRGNFNEVSGAFASLSGNFTNLSGQLHNTTNPFGSILDSNGNNIDFSNNIVDKNGSFFNFTVQFTELSGTFSHVTGRYVGLFGNFTNLTGYLARGGELGIKGSSDWNNDMLWLLWLFFASGYPIYLALSWLAHRKANEELRKIYVGDPTQKRHLRGWKTFAEMMSHLNYALATVFLLLSLVVLFDFATDVEVATMTAPLLTTTAVLWSLRGIIMYLLFTKSIGLIPWFIQAQILIWIYWDPHRALWSPPDTDFDDHYRLFATFSKICMPFLAVLGLVRERMFFEYSRWRISRGFYDAPGSYFTLRYLQRAPNISKMMWTPPEYGQYPTYIACTTVNGWTVIPPQDMLYDSAEMQKEQEFNFWYENLKDKDQKAIDAILAEVSDSSTSSSQHHRSSPFDQTRSLVQAVTTSVLRKKVAIPMQATQQELSNSDILDRAIDTAKEIVLKNPSLKQKVLRFEETKVQRAEALAQNLREMAWSQAKLNTSSYDILAMTTEGWWERYEDGMTTPLKIYPQGTTRPPNNSIVGANPDLLISEAMCMSAAAGSFSNGEFGELAKDEERTQVMFGLHMGRWVETNVKRGASGILYLIIVDLLIGLPVLILGGTDDPFHRTQMSEAGTNNGEYFQYLGGALSLLLFILWCFCLPLFSHYFPRIYPFLPRARDLSTLSGEANWSHSIPSMLYISDGGHTENLGLCPLLARRLSYIVIACGAEDETCEALRSALEQGRKKLGCWFRPVRADQQRRRVDRVTSDPELDLLSDIEFFARDDARVLVIEVIYRSQRRTWRNARSILSGSETKPNEKGFIFYLKPIAVHPRGFTASSDPTIRDEPFGAKCISSINHANEPLGGCCCVGCHRFGCLTRISGKFPFHHTAWQFFTAPLFDAYHAQGAQAMKDAFAVRLTANRAHDLSFDRMATTWRPPLMSSLVPALESQKKSN